jgi:DHA2 family multidrug resistance protein
VEDPPYIKRNLKAAIDFVGFGLLAVWLATLQIVLDKGQEADWFGADWIRWFTVISVAAFIGFIVWEFRVKDPLVNLRILRSRNFATGLMLMTVIGIILYGTTAELPLFLQTLMGYPALQSGLTQSPRGVAAFFTTFLVGRLVGKIPNRYLLCFGFSLLAYSSWMLSSINLQVSAASVMWPSILNGVAISFIFVPLTTATMGQLMQNQIGNASGLYNLMRNLGGSIGIAFVTTMLARGAQKHQALLVGHMTATDPAFVQQFNAAEHAFAHQANPVLATGEAYSVLYQTLDAQAHLWAFVDNFRFFCFLALASIPLVFLFKKVTRPPPKAAAH